MNAHSEKGVRCGHCERLLWPPTLAQVGRAFTCPCVFDSGQYLCIDCFLSERHASTCPKGRAWVESYRPKEIAGSTGGPGVQSAAIGEVWYGSRAGGIVPESSHPESRIHPSDFSWIEREQREREARNRGLLPTPGENVIPKAMLPQKYPRFSRVVTTSDGRFSINQVSDDNVNWRDVSPDFWENMKGGPTHSIKFKARQPDKGQSLEDIRAWEQCTVSATCLVEGVNESEPLTILGPDPCGDDVAADAPTIGEVVTGVRK